MFFMVFFCVCTIAQASPKKESRNVDICVYGGTSAGVAASMAIDSDSSVQEIDVTKLRKILRENPYLDNTTPEILVDEGDLDKISETSKWIKRFGGHYKNSYLWSSNQNKNASFIFIPPIKKDGEYEVYFYCTYIADDEIDESMAFNILAGNKKNTRIINVRKYKSSCVTLGTYSFSKNTQSNIVIDGSHSDGALFADAIY